MKLIVGLGNPGPAFVKSRHNTGFRIIDYIAEKNNLTFKHKDYGYYTQYVINKQKLILLKPYTFMNLSGDCVLSFMNYYKIKLEDVLIIYDDMSFDVGTFKIKKDGSAGGHNGLDHVLAKLGTEEVNRVKVGISKNTVPMVEYVLGNFPEEEDKKLQTVFPKVEEVVNDFSIYSMDKLMEKYNRKK